MFEKGFYGYRQESKLKEEKKKSIEQEMEKKIGEIEAEPDKERRMTLKDELEKSAVENYEKSKEMDDLVSPEGAEEGYVEK